MKRMAAIIWHAFSIGLLLFVTAIPDLHCCLPRLFSAGCPKEEKEEPGGPCHEKHDKESVGQPARRHRGNARGSQLPGSPLHSVRLHARDAGRHGPVCIADGLRGEDRLRNGCGAVLLR